LLYAPPDPFWGQRQSVHRHAGIGQRVDDRGRHALASAFARERPGSSPFWTIAQINSAGMIP
jgi:hypothetical protein